MSGPWLKNLSIRSKLLYSYALTFTLAMTLGSLFLFLMIKQTIEADIERELASVTASIQNMVQLVTDVSIRNHLRAVTDKNYEMVSHYYDMYKDGMMTEQEAKEKVADLILNEKIGKTGYNYCVDSEGIMRVHPSRELVGKNLSGNEFIDRQKKAKQGYLEYEWANPGENATRPKALYMRYFGPWDWIISTSSYRDEFRELVHVDDFRDQILSLTFGKTGYPYVITSNGTLVIHPKLEGVNVYNSTDSSGRMFIKEICERKNGKIIYPWQNPGEPKPREKLVSFSYIPEMDWIVASSSYLEEFYEPLSTIGYSFVFIGLGMLAFTIPVSWWISRSITLPLEKLMTEFGRGAEGDYSGRLAPDLGGEFGKLAEFYNSFMERLAKSRQRLEKSEKRYRSIFENSPEGIFLTSPEGEFLHANPSLAHMLGYSTPKELINDADNIGRKFYVDPGRREELIELMKTHEMASGFEAQLHRRDGRTIWVSINARAAKDSDGKLKYMEGLISDITHKKETENQLKAAKAELEQRVEQRTSQLSERVDELQRRNREADLLQELGDMMQVCRDMDESYPIIHNYLSLFFPGDESFLYILDEKDMLLGKITAQGRDASEEKLLAEHQCWALRQGKPYMVMNKDKVQCDHARPYPAHGYLCAPLIAQGELIGLLHIRFGNDNGPAESALERSERKLRLASGISENLALSLANMRLRENLRLQSIQDPLTGLYNRRYMEEALNREISRTKRHGHTTGVLMLDVDHFKSFNDNYGHEAGDAVLRELGGYITKTLRSEDIPCRYGGEEFALILHEITPGDAFSRADQLRKGIKNDLTVRQNGTELGIRVSIGVAICPEHGDTVESILKAADEALYQAKNSGRDKVVIAQAKAGDRL